MFNFVFCFIVICCMNGIKLFGIFFGFFFSVLFLCVLIGLKYFNSVIRYSSSFFCKSFRMCSMNNFVCLYGFSVVVGKFFVYGIDVGFLYIVVFELKYSVLYLCFVIVSYSVSVFRMLFL